MQDKEHVRSVYVVTTGHAGEPLALTTVGSMRPLVASVRRCDQGRRETRYRWGRKRGEMEGTERPSFGPYRSHVPAVSLPPATRHDVIAG